MIRTIVSATSELARASLANVVRGDTRLVLIADVSPIELDRVATALAPDVVVRDRDDDERASRAPSVTLVDDPQLAWRQARFDPSVARAILGRDATAGEIVAAIVAVAAGLIVVQPRALEDGASAPVRSVDADDRIEALTAREAEVLGELARGFPNKIIARRLRVSEHTVKFHVASIFAKLGATSRTEAVAYGVRHGLIML